MIDIDSTAIRALKESVLELKSTNIQLIFSCVKGPIRDAIRRCGVVGLVGPDHFFWSVHDAVRNYYFLVLNTVPPSISQEQRLQHVNHHDSLDPSKKDPGGSCRGYAQPQTNIENYSIYSNNSSNGGEITHDNINSNSYNTDSNSNSSNNNSSVVVMDNEFSPFVFDTEEIVENAHTPLLSSIPLPKLHFTLPSL